MISQSDTFGSICRSLSSLALGTRSRAAGQLLKWVEPNRLHMLIHVVQLRVRQCCYSPLLVHHGTRTKTRR